MPQVAEAAMPLKQSTPHNQTEFLLSALRAASLRARLAAVELDSVGIALKGGFVDCDLATSWLDGCGLLDQVSYWPAHEQQPA